MVENAAIDFVPGENNPGDQQAPGMTTGSGGSDKSSVNQLANTGANYWLLAIVSSLLIAASGSVMLRKKSYAYKLGE